VNYLIDTNIIFEIRKGRRCDPNVARWYEKNEDASLYLSVLVIGEIQSGIEKVRTKDTAKANALEQWLITVDKAFGERILPVDRAVAHEWGRLKVHRSLPVVDGLLAATAKIHRMTLVTRNTADIADVDVSMLNPFELRRDILVPLSRLKSPDPLVA
jgi:predicted nucleic acid-binding protein